MSVPCPYVTDPFRPLSSFHSNSYIYNSILVISSMWYVQVCLAVIACAHARTLLFMVQSRYESCVFPYGTRKFILTQNT